MAGDRKSIAQLWAGVRTLGLGLTLQAALYPLRRRYYESKFSGTAAHGSVWRGLRGLLAGSPATKPPNLTTMSTPGNLLAWDVVGQTLTVRCTNAALQITALADDVLRVRLSPSGDLSPLHSYAVEKADADWAGIPGGCKLLEGPETLEWRTSRLVCRIERRGCRLSFLDADGGLVHSDAQGMAWHTGGVARSAALEPEEHVYGLGEKAFPLERRGRSYRMWNVDPQGYSPGADPLYLNIPFYVGLHDGVAYGVFYDNSYRSTFDVGASQRDECLYHADGGELVYYLFYGPALTHVLERYTELTGRMPMPPLWALGYQQSRWSYFPEARVREIAAAFRNQRIPCDVLHLDIHYMAGYRCFTWSAERFPHPSALVSDLHGQGFRVVAMIDCGIKADPTYSVCAEGLAQGMFCKFPDGTPAGGPVWPGECYFPDFTSPRVREWWCQQHTPLLATGIDGLWNDMNEPTVIGPQGDTLPGCVRHQWEGPGAGAPQGTDHRQAHNVYGMTMARATREALLRLRPAERPFVFSRSGWAGMQRYATSWTADNQSTWEHLRLTMAMLMGLGLSGLGFSGPDVGGFEGGANGELLVRWTQMAAFLPFFRNHTALLNPSQEPWAFGEPYLSHNRSAIEWRYRLLPYLYTAMWQCAQHGTPIVRPLVWQYPTDPRAVTLDDEFLCGDALLVAPVCEPGATSRPVYLPAGPWFDFWTDELHPGGEQTTVAAPLERIPLFVRAGAVVPHWPLMQHTDERPLDKVHLHVYAGDGMSEIYEDAGQGMEYQTGAYRVTELHCRLNERNGLSIFCQRRGTFRPSYDHVEWIVHGLAGPPQQVQVDGQPVQTQWDNARQILTWESSEAEQVELSA